jgi:hypothetical protein
MNRRLRSSCGFTGTSRQATATDIPIGSARPAHHEWSAGDPTRPCLRGIELDVRVFRPGSPARTLHTIGGRTALSTAGLSRCSVPPRGQHLVRTQVTEAMFMPTPLPPLSPANLFATLPNADERTTAAPIGESVFSGGQEAITSFQNARPMLARAVG